MSDTRQPKFIVFNYVTSKIEQKDIAPKFGDPNEGVQAAAMMAYEGSTVGGTSLSSGSITLGPTPASLGDPAAVAMAAAQANLTPQASQTVAAAFGSIGQIGQMRGMIGSMHDHAMNIVDNGTRIFDSIDTVFKPNEVGSPGRCSSISDFIGSVQGKFNETIGGITGGLSKIANALISVPLGIINGFISAATALTTAILSGITAVIDAALGAVKAVTDTLFSAVGGAVKAVFDGVGSAISKVTDAISNEISNVKAALDRVANNVLRLVVPNCNPCIRQVLQDANPEAAGIDLRTIRNLDIEELSAAQRSQIVIGTPPT